MSISTEEHPKQILADDKSVKNRFFDKCHYCDDVMKDGI